MEGEEEKKEEKKEKKEEKKEKKDSESDDDQDEILEESPCGRWQKRREQVKQRDVPGIDAAYLSMDTETGNEVVWNEVQFSERKNLRIQEKTISAIFNNLMELNHCNLVKFYKWWTDEKSEGKLARIIFITEYMSSGNMSQFLKRTRKGNKVMSEKSWRKWATQILGALNYLHSSSPPIIHGNLSCNTIFIQQNGLIKIGCVAPNAIHHHVKTFRDNLKTMHYMAPEYETSEPVTVAADIYSLGVCLLEMAVLGFTNGESEKGDGKPLVVNHDFVMKKLSLLEDQPRQKDFILACLETEPRRRPSARKLLFHAVLFEVHSLKLLAAHAIVNGKQRYERSEGNSEDDEKRQYLEVNESLLEEHIRGQATDGDSNQRIVAEIPSKGVQIYYSQVPLLELDKFLEDVRGLGLHLVELRNGIYPLVAFASAVQAGMVLPAKVGGAKTVSKDGRRDSDKGGKKLLTSQKGRRKTEEKKEPETKGKVEAVTEKKKEMVVEDRRVVSATGQLLGDFGGKLKVKLHLRLDDQMNRELTGELGEGEMSAESLAEELVSLGLLNDADAGIVSTIIRDAYQRRSLDSPDPT